MRHADKRYPNLSRYIGTKALTLYQSVQQRPYNPGDLIIGFWGHRPRSAILLGVWRVGDRIETDKALSMGLLDDSFEDQDKLGKYYHEMIETNILKQFQLRLEIEWHGELAWRRTLNTKKSYPIRINHGCPVPFQGINSISLVMSELRIITEHTEWINALSNVTGVYIIIDETTGQQYIGSATGKRGIFQRWREYAKTGHGGNKRLIKLLESKNWRDSDLRFTLIETFPIDTPRNKIIQRENFWKLAMGSKTHGLNEN